MAPLLLLALALASGPEAAARRLRTPAPTPAAAPAPARPAAEVEAEARALLGAIDTPISPARWRSLGAPARAALEAFAADAAQLPTRRARAVEGLAALGTPGDGPRFLALALAAGEPAVVRLAAVRALAATARPGGRQEALRPLLEPGAGARVRAAAALAVVQAEPGACTAVRAQLAPGDEALEAMLGPVTEACQRAGEAAQ